MLYCDNEHLGLNFDALKPRRPNKVMEAADTAIGPTRAQAEERR